MKGAVIIFSVIWDSKLRKYREKKTASLSLEEIMSIYMSYKTEKEAQTVSKGLNIIRERKGNVIKTTPKP